MILRTDGEANFLLLIGQSIIIVEVKSVLTGQHTFFYTKQDAEVAFTTHQPDGIAGSLQVDAHLTVKRKRHNAETVSRTGAIKCIMKGLQQQII